MKLPSFLARRSARTIADALTDTRIVVVIGARQAGKSTLVRSLTKKSSNVIERRLDRPTELAAAHDDPTTFVEHDGLLAIDEIQRAPELLLPIKARVDDDPRPGQYILTGSARVLGLRDLPDALVGRTETVELWPFSQGEIDSMGDWWIDRAFAQPFEAAGGAPIPRREYLERAIRGGFPEAVRREGNRRDRFFESYVNDLLDRDVVQLAEIKRRTELHRLLRLVAEGMAQPLVPARLASALQVSKSTTSRYLSLFEEVFLLKAIPAWSANRTTRASRQPKALLVDSGLGAYLSDRTIDRLEREPARAGALLENFVLSEVARQITWSTARPSLGHFRTRDGIEVDGVIEARDGRIVGIEVKASQTVRSEDFRGLRHLQRRVPDRFHHGVVFYTGKETVGFGPGLTASPISELWAT